MNVYAYPQLSEIDFGVVRLHTTGLGNLLFPWARAVVAARRHGLTMVQPTWTQFGIGPVLRRESDFRFYHDLFIRPDDYIGGIRKLVLLTTARKVPEEWCKTEQLRKLSRGRIVIVFRGMKGQFADIAGESDIIGDELRRIAKPSNVANPSTGTTDSIAVHVRLGDFQSFDPEGIRQGKGNIRIPIGWYVDMVNQIKAALGEQVPVHVFSDGPAEEIRSLLAVPGVARVTYGSALADILALSKARVLVASGSTFSMWASFLGRMPTIWFRGARRLPPTALGTTESASVGLGETVPASIVACLGRA